jgi:hypothetical protein
MLGMYDNEGTVCTLSFLFSTYIPRPIPSKQGMRSAGKSKHKDKTKQAQINKQIKNSTSQPANSQ